MAAYQVRTAAVVHGRSGQHIGQETAYRCFAVGAAYKDGSMGRLLGKGGKEGRIYALGNQPGKGPAAAAGSAHEQGRAFTCDDSQTRAYTHCYHYSWEAFAVLAKYSRGKYDKGTCI